MVMAYSNFFNTGCPKKFARVRGTVYIVVSQFSSVFFRVSDKRRNKFSKDNFIQILQLSLTIFLQIRNKTYNWQVDVYDQ